MISTPKKSSFSWLLGMALFLSALGVFILGVSQNMAAAAENPESTYTQAKTAFANGQKEAAVKLFQDAASQGHTESQYQLGLLYMKGWGVSRNVKDAYRWLTLAEQAGHPQASRAKETLTTQLDAETRRLIEAP
ncbi:MAG: sel1 repeat family protein [Vampirovibrio sp.]